MAGWQKESWDHIQLGSQEYRLAEWAEGNHYDMQYESVQISNAQLVQGVRVGSEFQGSPDMLLWKITDWSGGEGQYLFDPEMPNMALVLRNVDPFTEPGKLLTGWDSEVAQWGVGGTGDFDEFVSLALGPAYNGEGNLWAMQRNPSGVKPGVYQWQNTSSDWDLIDNQDHASASTGLGCTAAGLTGDSSYLYYLEEDNAGATREIYRFEPAATWTLHNNDIAIGAHTDEDKIQLVNLGDYLYLVDPVNAKVFEIPKGGAQPVTSVNIYDKSAEGMDTFDLNQSILAVGDDRIYWMQNLPNEVVIHEITPTTAAGTGFGKELTRISGVVGNSIWFHLGMVYFIVDNGNQGLRRQFSLMYLDPRGKSFGTLYHRIRNEAHQAKSHPDEPFIGGAGQFNMSFFLGHAYNDDDTPALFALDSVGGGVAQVCAFTDYTGTPLTVTPDSMVSYRGDVFVAPSTDAATARILRTKWNNWRGETAETLSYAVTPVHDFGVAEEKVLEAIIVHTEPLPAGDYGVVIKVYTDGATSGTAIGAEYNTDSGTGTTLVASTDSTTINFTTMRIEVGMVDPGVTGQSVPVRVLDVEAWASIVKKRRVWRLLVDLTDDMGGPKGESGRSKITQLKNLYTTQAIEDFIDKYEDPRSSTEYDVRVRDVRVILSKAGEGYAYVELAEVFS